jgi:hypothetical protein
VPSGVAPDVPGLAEVDKELLVELLEAGPFDVLEQAIATRATSRPATADLVTAVDMP